MAVNRYREMKDRQQEEFNQFPMKFAFNKEQFEAGMKELGLMPEDTDKIFKAHGGGFYRKEDSPRLKEMLNRFDQEEQAAIAADQTGEGFIYEMFLAELEDHEFGYTEDPEETLDAIGYTWDQVQEDCRLKRGFDKAVMKIMGEMEE